MAGGTVSTETKGENMTMELSDWVKYTITAGQLREKLKDVPDDMPVILQKDAEGNGYSPLSSFDTECVYEPETTWMGEVYDAEPEDDDSYVPEDGTPVVLLGPVN